jgi:hypothetical protein
MGAESSKLKYTGSGQYDGADFTFEGPISMFKVSYTLGTKENVDLKYTANIFDENDFVFNVDVSALTVSGAALDDAAKAELV